MKLSIVATLYCSAPYLEEFHRRASAAAQTITSEYEVVVVNDGSPDNALEIALALYAGDPHLRIVDLSRNFGHHKAMMTGLAHARGELVFLIDSDLEMEPGLVVQFRDVLLKQGADVVYGVQESRTESRVNRLAAWGFYAAFNAVSRHPLPTNQVTTRLMTARFVKALIAHDEREIMFAGLCVLTGFKQVACPVVKRYKGSSTYSFARRVGMLVDAITSFSNRPLVYIFYLGLLVSVVAAVAASYLVLRRLMYGVFLSGWPSLIVSIWLLGGLMILSLGVVGIYVSKVFTETKHRPYTVIRRIYERDHPFGPL